MSAVTSIEMSSMLSGPIIFESVDFKYLSRPEVKIVDNFNLQVEKGTKIALFGSSGCGKSTISQLILKLYTPNKGSIKFNGCDIRQISDHSLRSVISIVNQEPNLFSCSIFENITYGCYEETTDVEMMQRVVIAATRANIHETIMGLPDGYRTDVGGRGSQLSGGQKQRIAIARALFRDPKFLLLDEATSALDAISKRHVEEAIANLPGDKTVIAITHDVKSLKNYDEIYHMQNGRVVQKRGDRNKINRLEEVTEM